MAVVVEARPELVGKRFLCVSGEAPPELAEIVHWKWRVGVIRAVSHRDTDNPELTRQQLLVKCWKWACDLWLKKTGCNTSHGGHSCPSPTAPQHKDCYVQDLSNIHLNLASGLSPGNTPFQLASRREHGPRGRNSAVRAENNSAVMFVLAKVIFQPMAALADCSQAPTFPFLPKLKCVTGFPHFCCNEYNQHLF
ncbi:probable JmjC domain-containing histone demethylation protein 2C isoform X1 [Tachysurus ichikawai]